MGGDLPWIGSGTIVATRLASATDMPMARATSRMQLRAFIWCMVTICPTLSLPYLSVT